MNLYNLLSAENFLDAAAGCYHDIQSTLNVVTVNAVKSVDDILLIS